MLSLFMSIIDLEFSLSSLFNSGFYGSDSSIFLNLNNSWLHSNQGSDKEITRYKQTVRSWRLIELKARNSLKVCFVFANYFILDTHNSTISNLSSVIYCLDPFLSNSSSIEISSCITFLGESLYMKC
jgi:hypothetical protein